MNLSSSACLLLLSLWSVQTPRRTPSGLPAELAKLATSSKEPFWAGYRVPLIAGNHHLCGEEEVLRLDGEGSGPEGNDGNAATADDDLVILYRMEGELVTRIRLASSECRIDPGPRALHWLDGISAAESLAELESVLSASNEEVADMEIQAIALHRDPGADGILGRIAADGASFGIRKKAVFWLGAIRAEGGFPILVRRLEDESDARLREQIVFALSLSRAVPATEKLVDIARSDRDAKVRERALFWLSQKAGKRAAAAIASAVRDDPEIDVKKQAVFALSQLPAEEGVPLLIEVASTHPDREVRKKAFFWLGQSHDPRALALFERILLEK